MYAMQYGTTVKLVISQLQSKIYVMQNMIAYQSRSKFCALLYGEVTNRYCNKKPLIAFFTNIDIP